MILPIENYIKPRKSLWKEEEEEPVIKVLNESKVFLSVAVQTDDVNVYRSQTQMTDSGFSEIVSKVSHVSISAFSEVNLYTNTNKENSKNNLKKLITGLRARIDRLKLRNKSAMCYFMSERLNLLYNDIINNQ